MKKPAAHTPARKPQTRVKELGYNIRAMKAHNKRLRILGHQRAPRGKKGI